MARETGGESGRSQVSSNPGASAVVLLGCGLSVVLLAATVVRLWPSPREGKAPITACRMNLSCLGKAMAAYCRTHDGRYPTPEKWCDLLIAEVKGLPAGAFHCSKGGNGRCHYAMNPLADPCGAPDVVLLFESKGGWNQVGGPELLTAERHDVYNVLLVDGSVMTVGPDESGGLKWTSEPRPVRDVRQGTTPAQ